MMAALPIVYLGQEYFARLWHKDHMHAVLDSPAAGARSRPSG
jgi:hypothetical protein